MPDIASIIISAIISLGLALAVLYLSQRAGLTDIQASVSGAQRTLVETLKHRLDAVEAENRRLENRVEYLENELTVALKELDRLRRYIIDHKVGPTDAGD